MENLYVESIVEEIAKNLEQLISGGVHTGKKLAIYGMDDFSFAIQSLLKNRNMTADYYISVDEVEVVAGKRRINGFASRYMRKNDDMLSIEHISAIDARSVIILTASKMGVGEMDELKKNGFKIGSTLFVLYEWGKDSFTEYVRDKRKIIRPEIQFLEKDILREFDRYCLENGLRYWVCGGTLLGTIRHKGFIPWDDDIDVLMPWKDYQKFVLGYPDCDKYKVASLDKEYYFDKYKTIWGKMVENTTIVREDDTVIREIHPVWIDIFPLVGLPTDSRQRSDVFKRELELERKLTERFYRNNGSMYMRNVIYADVVKLYEETDFDSADYAGVLGTKYRERDCTTRSVYAETLRMPFEDIEVNVPAGYQEYLDNLYGTGWMEVPEESKRVSHALEAYWL